MPHEICPPGPLRLLPQQPGRGSTMPGMDQVDDSFEVFPLAGPRMSSAPGVAGVLRARGLVVFDPKVSKNPLWVQGLTTFLVKVGFFCLVPTVLELEPTSLG